VFKLNSFSKLFSLVYLFFYLISAKNAISENFKQEILVTLENNLNKRNIDFIDKLFEDNESEKIIRKYNKLIYEFPNIKWKIKDISRKNASNKIINIDLTGSKVIYDKKYVLASNFNYIFSIENGKFKDPQIKNHLTTIRNDNQELDLDILIPDRVLTGSNYDLDIVINSPLNGSIIAGTIYQYQESNLIKKDFNLLPLASGGLFKVTRAPSKPGNQIWTGLIVHPKGLISFTKSVEIIENF
tara:strand:- start:238 stop:963 length:726 start_codon:yes stop_codon:yes gene_type:complete